MLDIGSSATRGAAVHTTQVHREGVGEVHDLPMQESARMDKDKRVSATRSASSTKCSPNTGPTPTASYSSSNSASQKSPASAAKAPGQRRHAKPLARTPRSSASHGQRRRDRDTPRVLRPGHARSASKRWREVDPTLPSSRCRAPVRTRLTAGCRLLPRRLCGHDDTITAFRREERSAPSTDAPCARGQRGSRHRPAPA